jgi:hypothetical protein
MALPIYPDQASSGIMGLGYSVKWQPAFFNQSQKTLSGASIDVALASTPLHNFELVYNFLRGNTFNHEFQIFMAFFLQMAGGVGRFQFANPDDRIVIGQVLGISDGVQDVYIIPRTFLGGGFGGTENVGTVDTVAPFVVYYAGVPKVNGVDYAIDNSFPGSARLALFNVPVAGSVITMDFSYYYYCKFADDTLTFEKFINLIWTVGSVKIQSCRVGA